MNKNKSAPLDKYEKQLNDALEKGEFVSVPNIKKEREKYRLMALGALKKTKNINIRLPEKDLVGLKTKAAENGLPYQTLLSTLVRQYVTGKITLIL